MSRIIETWRDPYGEGFTPTRPRKIELQPGLTVLVGCNGAGKTTLLQNIEKKVKNEHIPCFYYSNMSDGGSNSIGKAVYQNNLEFAAFLLSASEGEAVKGNFASIMPMMRNFIETGRISKMYDDELSESNERWLLLDAVDSGLSVDNVVEVVDILNLIIKDAKAIDVDMYIIIAANEYELCRNNPCFDVNTGKYITFKDYEDYRKFILKSRSKKEKRYAKKPTGVKEEDEE